MRNLIFFLILLLVFSCDDTPKEPEQKAVTHHESGEQLRDKGETVSYPEETYQPQLIGDPLQDSIEVLRGQFESIRYGVQIGEKVLLYVASTQDYTGKLGIVDTSGAALLPMEYERIGNPDLIAKGWIEVKKDGKYGLFSYETNALIPAEYDLFFPPKSSDQIAIGQKSTRFYTLKTGGETTPITEEGKQPRYHRLHTPLQFDIADQGLPLLIDDARFVEPPLDEPMDGKMAYIAPSYLMALEFAPPIITRIALDKQEFGIYEATGKVEENRSVGEKVRAFITSFYKSGVDGRGYSHTDYAVSMVDEYNHVLDQEALVTDGYKGLVCREASYSFVADTLIEVKEDVGLHPEVPYREMTAYRYYRLDEKGKIELLDLPRIWDFTRHVRITPDYFTGCFALSLDEEEAKAYDKEHINTLLTRHLSIEDLDIMRNEIFAEYGYRFQSEKWQHYFAQFEWYRPRFDNVDHLLTEIERHNILRILDMKNEMKGKEQEYTRPEAMAYSAAG